MFDRLWEYASAVFAYWQTWIAVAFMIEPAIERFFPLKSKWLDRKINAEKRRKIFIFIAIIAFVYANFNAFDSERSAKEHALSNLRAIAVFPFKVSITSNYQIIDADNGAQFDNNGATKGITFILPPWASNLRFSFIITAPWRISIAAHNSDRISVGGLSVKSSSVMSNTLFSSLSVSTSNLPGIWIVNTQTGSWTYSD